MNLANFIKYCLGYVKLSKQRSFLSQQKQSLKLSGNQINLEGLLNGDVDGQLAEIINLGTFYSNDPKNVQEEDEEKYLEEKDIANKIDYIHSKYRNDQFTKEISLNFGYFQIEIELEAEADLESDDDPKDKPKEIKIKVDEYPIFSLPVKIEKQIEKGVAKYYLFYSDQEIKINLSVLEKIFEASKKSDLFYQLLEEIGKDEVSGKFALPVTDTKILYETWNKVRAFLKLTDAKFNEESFNLETSTLSLNSRSNYFLAEDLLKLSKMKEEDLVGTALESWTNDSETNIAGEIPVEEQLYFPFPYDRYQLNSLSLLNNQASIIQGPPGTGKSETIANILCHLAANNKKVLFVSQKSQALKVVKDKLKKTGINYMFGYVPNPASSQLTEEDDADGIAPQLTALSTFIQKMDYKLNYWKEQNETLETISQKLGGLKKSFNNVLESERNYFILQQELKDLDKFNTEIGNKDNFLKNIDNEKWDNIESIIEKVKNIHAQISKYDKDENKKWKSDLPEGLFINKEYSLIISKILEHVEKSGYDGNSQLLRRLNNSIRNLQLRNTRSELPRELRNKIDEILSKDITKHKYINDLQSLKYFIEFNENRYLEEKLEEEIKQILDSIGLNMDQFEELKKLINLNDLDIEKYKNKLQRIDEIEGNLRDLSNNYNLAELDKEFKSSKNIRSSVISSYIQNIINKKIRDKWLRQDIKRVILRLAKAYVKSKKAYKTFDELRRDPENFNSIIDLVPVWIMELDDASRIIPLVPGMFDYVILDEASQCNVAYTLPVMFRAKKIVLVGDTEQMRDSTIRFKSNKDFDELAKKYAIPNDLQIKSTGNAVQSVLDIALLRGFNSNNLQYHYRSPRELIGFSNNYFYKPKGKELIALNNNYLTYKDTNKVMLIHKVDNKNSKEIEIADNINVAEAKEILRLFKELREDPNTRNKSVGILTFFNGQATFIRELFEEEGFKEEEDNYIVSIIEGIQGDEKDIIIYSFVIRDLDQKRKYGYLTGEGGDIQSDINKGRVNVAFTRARLQVHCFVSMDTFPEGIWIKKYIEYVEENGEVDFYSQDLKEFDSYFEEEFYSLAKKSLSKDFIIQNQVKSCGFKIDFVISNKVNGRKIAIECDGPTHFENEVDESLDIYVQSDEERQAVLVAAGWSFYRIKYSDWINKKDEHNVFIEDLKRYLNDVALIEHKKKDIDKPKEEIKKYETIKIDFDLDPYMNKKNIWLALSAWGKTSREFNGFQNKFCYSLGTYLTKRPELTEKQANFGRFLLNMAIKKGFSPQEIN
ncbi:MAG: AAA domain-containing protein [Candidatus Levybacteria bacterium]|nr:AAA domain-containing protein [Candidatus Levybacteria bacterium]